MSHNTFTFAGIDDPLAVTRVAASGDCAWISINIAGTAVDIWPDRAHTNTLGDNLDALAEWLDHCQHLVNEQRKTLHTPAVQS